MAAIASTQFITTLATLKLHLGITDTNSDNWLDQALAQVTKKFQTHCKRIFKEAHYTEFHDGTGRIGFIYADNIPITKSNISELNDDIARTFASATAFATNQYVVNDEEGRVELLDNGNTLASKLNPAVFAKGRHNIKLVYTGGYSAMPEDLQLGAIDYIARIWKRRDQKWWLIQSFSQRDRQTSIEALGRLPDDVVEMLEPYRLHRTGPRI